VITDRDPISQIPDHEHRIRRLEDEIRRLRGDGGVVRLTGTIDLGGHTIIGIGPSATPDGAMSADEIRGLLFEDLAIEELTSTGTSHAVSADVLVLGSGTPAMLVFVNGVHMERGASGQRGWSFDGGKAFSTVRALVAGDKTTVLYLKR
jgi:hypothetical protein